MKNKTFVGEGCPWNPDCPGEDSTIIIGHHPDNKPRLVRVIPGPGHPWICLLKGQSEAPISSSK